MELLLIGGIVLVAAVVLVGHLVKTLRGRNAPCCTCDTCPLPERDSCMEAASRDNAAPPECRQ